jgi:ABC-type antimicrobial peptide transport system permease subunit
MLDAHSGISNKHLLFLLLSLGAIAGCLFTIFVFLATMTFGRATGLALFLLVTALLIAGYVLAFMLLAFLAILLLTRYWQKPSK